MLPINVALSVLKFSALGKHVHLREHAIKSLVDHVSQTEVAIPSMTGRNTKVTAFLKELVPSLRHMSVGFVTANQAWVTAKSMPVVSLLSYLKAREEETGFVVTGTATSIFGQRRTIHLERNCETHNEAITFISEGSVLTIVLTHMVKESEPEPEVKPSESEAPESVTPAPEVFKDVHKELYGTPKEKKFRRAPRPEAPTN